MNRRKSRNQNARHGMKIVVESKPFKSRRKISNYRSKCTTHLEIKGQLWQTGTKVTGLAGLFSQFPK